jgi:hypothetical protein
MIDKEADMTPQELSSKKDPVSTSFLGSEEDFFTDFTLATYLEAISHHEPLIPPLDGSFSFLASPESDAYDTDTEAYRDSKIYYPTAR